MTQDPGPDGSNKIETAAMLPRKNILEVDVERFQQRLDHSGLSDAEKAEYLQVIWTIVLQFVEAGYGVHPVQQSCGQVGVSRADPASSFADAVESASGGKTAGADKQRTAESETQ